jgi:hypothetical protein
MEDDLKKRKDNLKKIKNKNGRRPKKNKKLVSIPPKFRGKPFLGLAQLSKIFCYLMALQSPVPFPSPLLLHLLPSLVSLISPLGSVLQTLVTGVGTAGGAAGDAGAAGAGGAATLPVVVAVTGGTASAVPAMMIMSSLLTGIGLGLLKGLFIGKQCNIMNYRMLIIVVLAELLKEQTPKKGKGYGHHPAPSATVWTVKH